MKIVKYALQKIVACILYIWSYLGILFSFTDDSNYGTVEYKNKFKDDIKEPRISLINLMLGNNSIFILTYSFKLKKLKWATKKSLDKMELFNPPFDYINEIVNRYEQHLITEVSELDIEYEKESLCYRINNEERRIEKSSEKVNLYATIILTVVPILLAFVDLKYFFTLNICGKIIVCLIIYSITNAILYILQVVKIQSINKSSFSDLRKSANHKIELNKQYHYDWQYLKRKADLFISYVKNLQNWIVASLLLSCLLVLNVSNVGYMSLNNNEATSQQVIHIFTDDINNPYSISAIKISELKLKIQKNEVRRLVVISSNDESEADIAKEIEERYRNLTIKYFCDETLKSNEVKIIEEE